MRFGQWNGATALLCTLMLTACVHKPWYAVDLVAIRAENHREVNTLVAQPTPDHLATAAWLARALTGEAKTELPLELIKRAEALAPDRPELAWLHLAICESLTCEAATQIEQRLKALDPTNGFVWTLDLRRALASGSDAAVTQAIWRIDGATQMSEYWNQLVVMMTDSLAVAQPSQSLAKRAIGAIGLVAALPTPPLQSFGQACRLDQLDKSGRRAACEAMVARLQESGSVITQMLGYGIEERWWPVGSPQREIVRAKLRQADYLLAVSSRIRWWRTNRDMATRIDAMRRTEREEDVEIVMAKLYGVPLKPPPDWKDTIHPE